MPGESARIIIENGDQIPPDWGAPQEAVRKTTVAIRKPKGGETFTLAGGTLTATPELDWIVVQPSGEEYPIKKTIFAATYEQTAKGRYRKTSRSRLVQVPEGVVVLLVTREGHLEVQYPDYVVIGKNNEVYANTAQWIAENMVLL